MKFNFDLKPEALEKNDPNNVKFTGTTYMKSPDGLKFFKPREGELEVIRLITFPEEGIFRKLVLIHFGVGGQNHVLCPAMFNESCSLCQVRSDMYAAKDKREKETNTKETISVPSVFYASRRSLVYLIDRAHPETGPQLFSFSQETMSDLDNQIKNLKTGVVTNIGHPITGKDIAIRKFKKGGSKYSTINELQLDQEGATPLSADENQMNSWLEFVYNNPIAGMLNRLPDKEVMALFNGGAAPESLPASTTTVSSDPAPLSVETKTTTSENGTVTVSTAQEAPKPVSGADTNVPTSAPVATQTTIEAPKEPVTAGKPSSTMDDVRAKLASMTGK